ncbi:MAG: pyridoxal-5'-phosphate-dependent protein subunit beta, partial [Rhodospirillaceae bacterium]|nr:pyridoxal-5'-phosphate-dependent protein subunit beta [Rhodospirillaceae bacterium]
MTLDIADRATFERNVARFKAAGIELPRISDLADPPARLAEKARAIAEVDPDAPDPRNLFRVHWHNGADRRALVDVPDHLVVPPELTGIDAT